MKSMSATVFKAKCLAILDEVQRTGEVVVILKRGKRVAELGPVRSGKARYPQDELRGTAWAADDLIEPPLPEEAWDALNPKAPLVWERKRTRRKKKKR
ncbi:MAG: type II toxin-antitoxin system prevent-host-death family antitoxin [Deltaproteobacteria bacterium]|nr:type II toxin-antitoxin system prevent-host-death family antitoxin [Deltaproteobacteria bacterium]